MQPKEELEIVGDKRVIRLFCYNSDTTQNPLLFRRAFESYFFSITEKNGNISDQINFQIVHGELSYLHSNFWAFG